MLNKMNCSQFHEDSGGWIQVCFGCKENYFYDICRPKHRKSSDNNFTIYYDTERKHASKSLGKLSSLEREFIAACRIQRFYTNFVKNEILLKYIQEFRKWIQHTDIEEMPFCMLKILISNKYLEKLVKKMLYRILYMCFWHDGECKSKYVNDRIHSENHGFMRYHICVKGFLKSFIFFMKPSMYLYTKNDITVNLVESSKALVLTFELFCDDYVKETCFHKVKPTVTWEFFKCVYLQSHIYHAMDMTRSTKKVVRNVSECLILSKYGNLFLTKTLTKSESEKTIQMLTNQIGNLCTEKFKKIIMKLISRKIEDDDIGEQILQRKEVFDFFESEFYNPESLTPSMRYCCWRPEISNHELIHDENFKVDSEFILKRLFKSETYDIEEVNICYNYWSAMIDGLTSDKVWNGLWMVGFFKEIKTSIVKSARFKYDPIFSELEKGIKQQSIIFSHRNETLSESTFAFFKLFWNTLISEWSFHCRDMGAMEAKKKEFDVLFLYDDFQARNAKDMLSIGILDESNTRIPCVDFLLHRGLEKYEDKSKVMWIVYCVRLMILFDETNVLRLESSYNREIDVLKTKNNLQLEKVYLQSILSKLDLLDTKLYIKRFCEKTDIKTLELLVHGFANDQNKSQGMKTLSSFMNNIIFTSIINHYRSPDTSPMMETLFLESFRMCKLNKDFEVMIFILTFKSNLSFLSLMDTTEHSKGSCFKLADILTVLGDKIRCPYKYPLKNVAYMTKHLLDFMKLRFKHGYEDKYPALDIEVHFETFYENPMKALMMEDAMFNWAEIQITKFVNSNLTANSPFNIEKCPQCLMGISNLLGNFFRVLEKIIQIQIETIGESFYKPILLKYAKKTIKDKK